MTRLLISTQSTVEYDGHHHYGNTIRALWNRYRSFADQCTIICYEKSIQNATQDRLEDEIKLVFVQKINSIKTMVSDIAKQNAIIAEEQVRQADFCIVHLPSGNGYQVIGYCKKYAKPYLTVVCGCPWDALWNHGWKGKLMARKAYKALLRVQSSAPYSIYVTNEFLQKRYPTDGKSIGCSNVNISTGIEGVMDKRMENIKKRNSSGRILKIGTAAAVDVPYKGQEYVIRALSKLKKKGIYYEYHLIGKGDDSRLRSIAKKVGVEEQVYFHGAIPHEKVLDFLDEMDLYVQPSKQEGLPRSLIEAMSRGLLCLGSKTAGIPELLDPKFVFSKGNVNEIKNILKGINTSILSEQGYRNFEKAKEYDRDLLNKRRTSFIEHFMKENNI